MSKKQRAVVTLVAGLGISALKTVAAQAGSDLNLRPLELMRLLASGVNGDRKLPGFR